MKLKLSILFSTATCGLALYVVKSPTASDKSTRRSWLAKCLIPTSSSAILLLVNCPSSSATAVSNKVNELPSKLKQYTALAPLGPNTSTGIKLTGLSLSEIATQLAHDLVYGSSGKGGYFISGDISTQIFRDDCTFIDPTNSVNSLSRYQKALTILFDPSQSHVELLEDLQIDKNRNTITAKVRSDGVLKLPWSPRIIPYESTITYTIDTHGLIQSQVQEWNKSASRALQETFTPSSLLLDNDSGTPYYSSRQRPSNEPKDVTTLFDLVNSRRPEGYNDDHQISSLIDRIVTARYYDSTTEDLNGKWKLVYLQPGPNGTGIDRRIPFFPELSFNNNYQIFSISSSSSEENDKSTIINVGELLGPLLEVRVSGTLQEEEYAVRISTSNQSSMPKRYHVTIDNGGLCIGTKTSSCLPLPIRGEGIFDSVYLGKRLRIGQNINGGGARVVQVKL
jgi:hypothetical protein